MQIRKQNLSNFYPLSASLLLVTLFFILWPSTLIHDDAGIILKYMENFSKGFFFRYNAADPPVFGISGFLYGLLCGFFCALHLFSPLSSLFAGNFIGFFITAFFTLKIIQHYLPDSGWSYPLWLVTLFSAPHFVANIKTGMETPLHLAILLFCIWSYLKNKTKLVWLLGVFAIISKLDALPVVMVIWIFYLIKLSCRKNTTFKSILTGFLLYGILPLFVWCLFTLWMFDGPFPQTAKAKWLYFSHPSAFSYLRKFYHFSAAIFVMLLMLLFYALAWISKKRKQEGLDTILYAVASAALVGLYTLYNPLEQHSWYYAIPEFLVMLQIALLTVLLFKHYRDKKKWLWPFLFAGVFLFTAVNVYRQVRHTLNVFNTIERERIAAGNWLDTHSSASDTLLAGHGHIAYHSHLYTIDYSGLNSKISTDLKLDLDKLINRTNPAFIALPGLLSGDNKITTAYNLVKSFYNIAADGNHPAWRLYTKSPVDDNNYHYIKKEQIAGAGICEKHNLLIASGSKILFKHLSAANNRLITGIERSPLDILLTAYLVDSKNQTLLAAVSIQGVNSFSDPGYNRTTEWILPLPDKAAFDLLLKCRNIITGEPVDIKLINPVIEHSVAKGKSSPSY
ncbi:hypothetical protein GF407_05895 [candidate division KSB1 bacterium]|nr:hypothetical protein [candidate division KSB1 bacterium]